MDGALSFDDVGADVTLTAGTVRASQKSADWFNTAFLY